MDWQEHEKDELLVRYLDHETSLIENERIEQLLRSDPSLRQRLSDWQDLLEKLGEMRAQNPTGRHLDASFADRVIQGAQSRVRDQGDSSLAPWISRESLPSAVESANRLQSRESDASDPSPEKRKRQRSNRQWIVTGSLMAIAASLLAMVVLNLPASKPNVLINPGPTVAQQLPTSNESSSYEIVVDDKNDSSAKVGTRSNPEELGMKSAASLETSIASTPRTSTLDANKQVEDMLAVSKQPSNSLSESSPARSDIKEAASLSVAPDLKPSVEQIKMLEDMMTNPNGMFLMVVDVQLPAGINDLDALRGILDRHDIAWASELDIDESTQSTLAKSRMIAEAGKRGIIPDYFASDRDQTKSKEKNDKADNAEVVSLVFVKARGTRLDAALVEVMRQTDEFPVFSFDLAFDPPTHALMSELRFIQEASLSGDNLPAQENVSNIIQRSRSSHFVAGPRRTAAMELDTRRRGRLPLDAETMNPVSYALFIVRHAAPSSSR